MLFCLDALGALRYNDIYTSGKSYHNILIVKYWHVDFYDPVVTSTKIGLSKCIGSNEDIEGVSY